MATKKIDFNKNLVELDKIVKKMQQPDISLEKSLEYFEKGVQLHNSCKQAIEKAQLRVTKLSDEEYNNDSKNTTITKKTKDKN